MDKLISIKEARTKKGLSINDLSNALKLDLDIVRLLDDNLKLPKKYRAYESTYIKSIYRYLGYDIKYKNSISDLPIDYTKLSIIYFTLLLVFTILTLLSFNIYNKFNDKITIRAIETDQIYADIVTISSLYELNELNHDDFINNLILLKRANYSQKFSIFVKPNKTIYYKIQDKVLNTLQFGEIVKFKELIVDLDNDFLIDLSNINNIEKIIYRGIEFKLNKELNSYILNFNIRDLDTLL